MNPPRRNVNNNNSSRGRRSQSPVARLFHSISPLRNRNNTFKRTSQSDCDVGNNGSSSIKSKPNLRIDTRCYIEDEFQSTIQHDEETKEYGNQKQRGRPYVLSTSPILNEYKRRFRKRCVKKTTELERFDPKKVQQQPEQDAEITPILIPIEYRSQTPSTVSSSTSSAASSSVVVDNGVIKRTSEEVIEESVECIFGGNLKRNENGIVYDDFWDPILEHLTDESSSVIIDAVTLDRFVADQVVNIVEIYQEEEESRDSINTKSIYTHRRPPPSPYNRRSNLNRQQQQLSASSSFTDPIYHRRQNSSQRRISPPSPPPLPQSYNYPQLSNFDAVQSPFDNQNIILNSPCCHHCGHFEAPSIPPEHWPQKNILLRPSPGSGTIVKGIRYSSSDVYFERPWPEQLSLDWNADDDTNTPLLSPTTTNTNNLGFSCRNCTTLPINNGNEPPGKTLVTDFESEFFAGTLLVRIRHSHGTTPQPYLDDRGYFAGMNRRFQAVIKGRFKKPVSVCDCVAGHTLHRPCGRLPPRWVRSAAVKVLGFFAPQLQANFEGGRPSFLSPLASTPQSVVLDDAETGDDAHMDGSCGSRRRSSIERDIEEPNDYDRSLLSSISSDQQQPSSSSSKSTKTPTQRAKQRKAAFDKVFSSKNKSVQFLPGKEYTFEFLQHLIQFDDLSVELGSYVGRISLVDMLDGQPLKIMGAKVNNVSADGGGGGGAEGRRRRGSNKIDDSSTAGGLLSHLWSFDLWHENLYPRAKECDDAKQNGSW